MFPSKEIFFSTFFFNTINNNPPELSASDFPKFIFHFWEIASACEFLDVEKNIIGSQFYLSCMQADKRGEIGVWGKIIPIKKAGGKCIVEKLMDFLCKQYSGKLNTSS
jgi:hypothetical protein